MALGGRKKGRGRKTHRRAIQVEGKEYYWRIDNCDRASMRDGRVVVVIGQAKQPHRRVTLTGPGLSYSITVVGGPTFSHSKVTPRLVRAAILFAEAHGWSGPEPALAVSCSREGELAIGS